MSSSVRPEAAVALANLPKCSQNRPHCLQTVDSSDRRCSISSLTPLFFSHLHWHALASALLF